MVKSAPLACVRRSLVDYVTSFPKRQIQALIAEVERLKPRKRKKVGAILNERFVGIEQVMKLKVWLERPW